MKIKFEAKANGMVSELLCQNNSYISKPNILKQLEQKEIKVNDVRIAADCLVSKGSTIEIFVPTNMIPKLELVFSDDNIIVVYKPAMCEVEVELIALVRLEYPSAVAVHRLDRNTRGIVVFALNEGAEQSLLTAFKDKLLSKYYLAEVVGKVDPKSAVLKAFLFKDSDKKLSYVSDTRKIGYAPITTAYKVLEYRKQTTILEVELLSGRMHQIRVHMAHIGHPLLGDGKYGDNKVNTSAKMKFQQLLCNRIVFGNMPKPLHYLQNVTVTCPEKLLK